MRLWLAWEFQRSKNRNASVLTDSYLREGANKQNVKRQHFLEPWTVPPV